MSTRRIRIVRVSGLRALRLLAACFIVAAMAVTTGARAAVVLAPGDIVAIDQNAAFSGTGELVKVNPVTGAQTPIATGSSSLMYTPYDAVYLNNKLYAPDGSLRQLDRIDPLTGSVTAITSFTDADSWPVNIAVDGAGKLLVTDTNLGRIYRIDPDTGARTTLSSGGLLSRPHGLTLEPATGKILVADFGNAGRLIRVDPTTGAQTLLSSNGLFVIPRDVQVATDGTIFVSDSYAGGGNGAVLRVNPTTGAQTLVATGGFIAGVLNLAIEADGKILLAETSSDVNAAGGILRIDPTTGAQTRLSFGGRFLNPAGVIVIPEPGAMLVVMVSVPFLCARARRNLCRRESSVP
jgi:streptogramin lyase